MMQPHARVRVIYSNGYETSYILTADSADRLDRTINSVGVSPNLTYAVDTPILEDGSVARWYISGAISMGIIRPPEMQFGGDLDLAGKHVHQTMGHA